MDIKQIRLSAGMTQNSFANYFGIPIGTLRNWEQGIASPPNYVFQMIQQSIRRDKMINVETIKFIDMLNQLAYLTENGIEDFANATCESFGEKIFYDNQTADENNTYRIVLDACVSDDPKCYHHDVISYYDHNSQEYSIRVVFDDEDGKPYINIKFAVSENEIAIDDGKWYFI